MSLITYSNGSIIACQSGWRSSAKGIRIFPSERMGHSSNEFIWRIGGQTELAKRHTPAFYYIRVAYLCEYDSMRHIRYALEFLRPLFEGQIPDNPDRRSLK